MKWIKKLFANIFPQYYVRCEWMFGDGLWDTEVYSSTPLKAFVTNSSVRVEDINDNCILWINDKTRINVETDTLGSTITRVTTDDN